MPKKAKNRFLINLYESLVYILPAMLFFSYYPLFSLGGDETMNFEFSLPIIWLVLFDVVGVIVLAREKLLRESLKKWRYLLFPVFVTFTILWSANILRGILTCGMMWLIIIAVMLLMESKSVFSEEFFKKFLKWFLGSALAACAWCFLQCVLDVAGVSREYTLMCEGCTYHSFGFPHPNGFAIEPQFMGNLLLAPTIVSGWLYLKKKDNKKAIAITLLLFCFSATLFLTFSRGAIYAFIVAMMFMTAWMAVRKKSWRVLKPLLIVAMAFLFTLNLQGILAQVSPTNDTYQSGVAKVLNHLSLGIIDIRQQDENAVEDEGVSDDDNVENNESIHDGYVAESTEIRRMLTRNALTLWSRDVRTVLFGVGIGGAGHAMSEAGLTSSPKEIVQNEYASLLLEVGLVGAMLAVVFIIMVIKVVIKGSASVVIISLLVAYSVSLLFFAGLPNALQIYLLPATLWLAIKK